MKPEVRSFFDPATFTISHFVREPGGTHCAIIAYVRAEGLTVDWILETHVHADHLSAGPHLKEALGGQTGIGA